MSDINESGTRKDTIWSFPYIVLMTVNFFQSMAALMANTTLPVFANHLGASASIVGIVTGSFAVTALLVRPFAGPAFDSFSRKKMLLADQAIICLSLAGYGFIHSLPALIAIRLFHGIGIGCGGPLAMSLVSEFLPPKKFASGISIYTLAQSFAQVIGPAVGLYLMNAFGFSMAYFMAAGSLLAAMCCLFFIKEPPRRKLPYELKLDRMFAKEALDKGLALMLLATAFSCTSSYLVLYAYELGIANVGLYFTVYACCLIVMRPLFGTLADKFGAKRVLLLGVICFAASYATLSMAHDMRGLLTAAVIGSAGFGSSVPLIQTLALSSVDPRRRGAASNTAFTGLDVGMLVGPPSGGIAVDLLALRMPTLAGAYSTMWLVMLIPVALAFILVIRWNLRPKDRA